MWLKECPLPRPAQVRSIKKPATLFWYSSRFGYQEYCTLIDRFLRWQEMNNQGKTPIYGTQNGIRNLCLKSFSFGRHHIHQHPPQAPLLPNSSSKSDQASAVSGWNTKEISWGSLKVFTTYLLSPRASIGETLTDKAEILPGWTASPW